MKRAIFALALCLFGAVPTASFAVDAKCHILCFHSPDYWLLRINKLPAGTVLIGGTNLNIPVSTKSTNTIKKALQGGSSPRQQLNRVYVAAQLSLLTAGGPVIAADILWSNLSCFGLMTTYMVNGVNIGPDAMLKDLFMQAQIAVTNKNAYPGDLMTLTMFFEHLTRARTPITQCGGDLSDVPPMTCCD